MCGTLCGGLKSKAANNVHDLWEYRKELSTMGTPSFGLLHWILCRIRSGAGFVSGAGSDLELDQSWGWNNYNIDLNLGLIGSKSKC